MSDYSTIIVMKRPNYLDEAISLSELRMIYSSIDEAPVSCYCWQHWWPKKGGIENRLSLTNQIINWYLFQQHQLRPNSMNCIKNVEHAQQTALERINRSQSNHRSQLRELTIYLLLFLYINLFILLTSSQILYSRNEHNNINSSQYYNNNNYHHLHHANRNHHLPYKLPEQEQQHYHQTQQQPDIRQQQRYNSKLNDRPHQSGASIRSTCRDCLAIPLVAVLGSNHFNGFIIPPVNRQISRSEVNEKEKRLTNYGIQANQADKQTSGGYDSLQFAQHLKNYYVKEHNLHNHHRFEPQSDENCPMTGTLTVCDQISPYPADLILNKLDSAKKVLQQSYFNIDSLFSDERDHSNEPFEDLMISNNAFSKGKRFKSTSLDVETFNRMKFESEGEFKIRQKKVNDDYVRSSMRDSYNQNHDHDNHNYRQSRTITPSQSIPSEDFVDLVERKAFSLPDTRSLRHQQVVGEKSVVVITNPTSKQDKLNTHTNGYLSSNGRRENWRHLSDPTLISNNTTLASRLLSMSQTLNTTTTTTTTSTTTTTASPGTSTNTSKEQDSHETQMQLLETFGEEEEDEVATYQPSFTSSSGSSSVKDDLSGFSSNVNVLKTAKKEPATIQTRTINSIPIGRQHNSNLKYLNNKFNQHKRLRRQASAQGAGPSGVNGNGNGGSLPAAEMSPSEGSQVDPDSSNNSVPSTFGETGSNNQQIPEPICRAKSIYISPRAALNDKKLWKYVVNAPERNPRIRQIIRVDICEPFWTLLGSSIYSLWIHQPMNSIKSKQKYSKKKLLALDSQSGLLEVDTFFIPSCCVCQLIRESQPFAMLSPPSSNEGENSQPATENDTN